MITNMMGFGVNASNYEEALKEIRKCIDEEILKDRDAGSVSISIEGNKTTVKLSDGRVGTAKCNPCDTFDVITGIRVALDDIEKKSKKLTNLEKEIVTLAEKLGAKKIYCYRYDDEYDADEMCFINADEECVMHIYDNDLFTFIKDDETIALSELKKDRW